MSTSFKLKQNNKKYLSVLSRLDQTFKSLKTNHIIKNLFFSFNNQYFILHSVQRGNTSTSKKYFGL